MSPPKPPVHLSKPAADLWRRLHDGHAIDDPGGLALLDSAAEAWQRMDEARRIIEKEGLILAGRQGPKAHPACMIEHNAAGRLHAALRLLRLSPEDA